MKYRYFLFTLLLFKTINGGVFIVVHGTWASSSAWSKPDGDFFTELEKSAHERGHATITYTWSGNLNEAHRLAAGKGLAKLIRSYPPDTECYIVAHSHGGNVAIIASQELGKMPENKHRIKILYALATPIESQQYMPDMAVIDYFYNLFSLVDFVQPVLGLFNRVYPPHERMVNLRTVINDREPSHCDIQHPAIARWLPSLHGMLITHQCSPVFDFHVPGIIKFYDTEKPRYELDIDRDALLEKDKRIHEYMFAVFRKKQCHLNPSFLPLHQEPH